MLGVLVFQLDPSFINELASNYIGLGESGETVLATLEDDYAVVTVPLRHDSLAAFTRKMKIGSEDGLPIQAAVNRNNDSGKSIDYRGNEILSVWRYIPQINWGLVVKIDTEEAYAPAVSFLNRTLLLVIITVLLVSGMATLISNSIVNPIISLKQSLGSSIR